MSDRRLRIAWAGLLLLLAACARGPLTLAPPPDGALRVATHNVHYIDLGAADGRWSVAGFERRKPVLDRTFKALQADIVAFQEMETFRRGSDGSVNLARDWLAAQNGGYAVAAEGDWRAFPSTQPIFYRRDRLALIDQGWFFFSDTPEAIYSRSFDGGYPAFASWARFRDRKEGGRVSVVNVHFDHASGSNRLASTALVAERLAARIEDGEAVILVGDLNALAGSPTRNTLAETGVDFVSLPGATYHFDRGLNLFGAIDHIGATDALDQVGKTQVMRGRFGNVWPSDHYPVVADFRRGE